MPVKNPMYRRPSSPKDKQMKKKKATRFNHLDQKHVYLIGCALKLNQARICTSCTHFFPLNPDHRQKILTVFGGLPQRPQWQDESHQRDLPTPEGYLTHQHLKTTPSTDKQKEQKPHVQRHNTGTLKQNVCCCKRMSFISTPRRGEESFDF